MTSALSPVFSCPWGGDTSGGPHLVMALRHICCKLSSEPFNEARDRGGYMERMEVGGAPPHAPNDGMYLAEYDKRASKGWQSPFSLPGSSDNAVRVMVQEQGY